MLTPLILAISLTALTIGTYTDFKTREVPDWLNFSIIGAGLGIHMVDSAVNWMWQPVVQGLLGFAVFFLLSWLMYRTGQWGGGDAKMMMGLGALLGLTFALDTFMLGFVINMLLVGAVYGLIWFAYLSVRHRSSFSKEFVQQLEKHAGRRKVLLAGVLALLIAAILSQDSMLKLLFFTILVAAVTTAYLWIFAKAIERSCLHKKIDVERLTEGDWILKDVIIDKKRVCGPKDLGITRKQIKRLISYKRAGRIKKILVKEGIPFVPSFLLAFLLTMWKGNLLLLLI